MKTERILALDLGSASFKLALLEIQESRQRMTQVRVAELPAQSDPKTREAMLKSLLAGLDLTQIGEVVSVVDDPFACLRTVSTPPMPAAELAHAVRWQLQPFLAFPSEEAAVEYEPVSAAPNQEPRKLHFLAVAFPAAKIRDHLAFLGQTGLKPTQLLPKEMAIGAWLGGGGSSQVQQSLAVLEVGATGCEFIILENGRPFFTRKISGGGSSLTREMTDALMTAQGQVSLTEAEAETFKRSVGIPGTEEPATREVKGVSGSQIFALIRGGLERLAMEVERSLTFYSESGALPAPARPAGGGGQGQAKIGSLLLVGGGAHLKGLAQWLQERLGIQVVSAPVLEKLSVGPGALQGSASAVPLSLVPVLGAAINQGKGMNLLPEELKENLRRQVRRVAVKGLLTGVGLGAVLLWVGIQVSRQSLAKQIAAFQLEQQAVAAQWTPMRVALAAYDRVAGEPEWETTLRWLSQVVPPEICLVELNAEGKTLAIRGQVRRRSRQADEALGEFMRLLEEGRMTRVTLRSSRLTDAAAGTLEFEIAGDLR